jgi:5-methylcytosine-specific restriction endonuclease McrA
VTAKSWKEARDTGADRYFTGRPCKRGHVAHRDTKGRCYECHKVVQAEWSKKNPERVKSYLSAWYSRNKDHCSAYTKAWHAARPGYSAEKAREWLEGNREYRAAQTKAFRQQNPERIKAQGLRRRNAGPLPHPIELKRIFKSQKGRCAYCRTDLTKLPTMDVHLDHITPVAKGGTNIPSNLQFCCKPCNLRKSKKDPISFARERGMLL